MTEMIELDEGIWHPSYSVPGWTVAISQQVWDRCVAVPADVEGQSEEGRLWDLLVYLWADFRDHLASGRQAFAGFVFRVGVVNDNRDWDEDADKKEWPDTTVSLIAVAGVKKAGQPCLFVLPLPNLDLG